MIQSTDVGRGAEALHVPAAGMQQKGRGAEKLPDPIKIANEGYLVMGNTEFIETTVDATMLMHAAHGRVYRASQ